MDGGVEQGTEDSVMPWDQVVRLVLGAPQQPPSEYEQQMWRTQAQHSLVFHPQRELAAILEAQGQRAATEAAARAPRRAALAAQREAARAAPRRAGGSSLPLPHIGQQRTAVVILAINFDNVRQH